MQVTFHPLFSPVLIAIATSISIATLFLREWNSTQCFRVGRILAVMVVMIALLGIVLRPSLVLESSGKNMLLLTEGFNGEVVDSLIQKHPELSIVTSPGMTEYRNSEKLSSWNDVAKRNSEIRFVAGAGVPIPILDEMDDHHFSYSPPRSPTGITEISTGPFFANRSNTLHGKFRSHSGKATLILSGPGGAEDSVQFTGMETFPFQLSFNPKQSGKLNYTLSIREKETITEPLPLSILAEEKLSVLFLLDAPSSETRYLKNFLGDRNHAVIARYRMSRSAFRYEYLNTKPVRADLLSESSLSQGDLIIIESSALSQLPNPERQASHVDTPI